MEKIDDVREVFINDNTILNGMRNIKKISPIPGQSWCVIIYVLSNTISKKGEHGLWFLIGTFSNYSDAVKKTKKLIKTTGIKSIMVRPTCKWHQLNDTFNPNETKYVNTENIIDNKLKEFNKHKMKELEKIYNEHENNMNDIENEHILDNDNTSIECYTRKWYLISKKKVSISELKQRLHDQEKEYESMKNEIKQMMITYPNYENTWLDTLNTKLSNRNESHIFDFIKDGYNSVLSEFSK